MKKLWDLHSYTFILIVGTFALISTLLFTNNDKPIDDYQQITVKKGDTVWDMAEQFVESEMTKTEFVSWVQENNDLHINQLEEGQTIIIPVEKKTMNTELLHLADSEK